MSDRAPAVRVLLADDQALIRVGFRAILGRADDIEVVAEAADGDAAVALTQQLRPDVVLMDIRMPHLDGIAATERITGDPSLSSTHVIVVTTYELDSHVFDALRAGASGFLLKDLEPDDLRRAVRVVAGGEALLAPSVTRRLIAHFVSTGSTDAAGRGGSDGPARSGAPPHGVDATSDGQSSGRWSAAGVPTDPARRSMGDDSASRLADLTEREREVVGLVGEGLSNAEIAVRLYISPATAKTHVSHAMIKVAARDRAQLVVFAYETGLVVAP